MKPGMNRHIALMGRARSGKDTVASHLVENFGYRRVAFADPLKEIAERLNPQIMTSDYAEDDCELSWLLRNFGGWDRVKDEHPESRRFLQSLGSAVRDVLGEDVWLQRGLSTASYAMLGGSLVVFTDVRYRNEASALRNAGFTMVRIERPETRNDDQHVSETELDDYAADVVLVNDGSVSDLLRSVEGLVR